MLKTKIGLWLGISVLAPVLGLAGCATTQEQPAETPTPAPQPALSEAQQMAQDMLIVDTHIDVPYRLHKNWVDVSGEATDGQFDYPRALAGGLNAPFMSVYIPAAVDSLGNPYEFAEYTIGLVERLFEEHPDKFAPATCSADLLAHKASGHISMPMGMENGAPIEGKMENLKHFFDRGIRYITLTHSKSNHISDSSYDPNERWGGLSEFGKELVKAMNDQGMMVDISHVSDAAFWQALELSAVPMIASHSSMRKFTPGFQRNMSDEMVQALANAGGVIQINYGSSFLTKAAQDYGKARTAAAIAYKQANHLEDDAPELKDFLERWKQDHPYPFADLGHVLDHIDRAVDVAGIDAVGIGSDYDGVGDTLPTGLKSVDSFPVLIEGLLKRGYSRAAIEKIMSGNLMRVWRQVEAYAAAKGNVAPCSAG